VHVLGKSVEEGRKKQERFKQICISTQKKKKRKRDLNDYIHLKPKRERERDTREKQT
jgi:hypothetical protein